MYYTYILTNKNHSVLYVGVTGNLEGRIWEHRQRITESFTKRYQVTKLIWYEDYPDPTSAIMREKQLKGWRREKKIALINKMNPRWIDLYEEMMDGYGDLLQEEKTEPLIVKDTTVRRGRFERNS
jgi:putative endonuclease